MEAIMQDVSKSMQAHCDATVVSMTTLGDVTDRMEHRRLKPSS